MKPVLVKKALPRHWSKDFDTVEEAMREAQAARMASKRELGNIEDIPITPGTLEWELGLTRDGKARSLIPGVSRGRVFDQGLVDQGGAFAYPTIRESFFPSLHPEVMGRRAGVPLGRGSENLMMFTTEKPRLHATQKEGREQTEAFYPGGFDPAQTYLLSDPTKTFRRNDLEEANRAFMGRNESNYVEGTEGADTPVGRIVAPMSNLVNSKQNPLTVQPWGRPQTVEDVFQLSEPMDIAMRLLKMPLIPPGQTTLGEHHADFPSPYGPVVGYHGTTGDNFMDIMGGAGIQNPDPNYRTITTNPSEAATYGMQRSGDARNTPSYQSQPKLVGIRQAAFDQNHPNYIGPSHGLKNSDDYQGAQHYGGNIPRQFLTNVPMSNETLQDTMQAREGRQDIIERNMSYPAESQNYAQRRFQERQNEAPMQFPIVNQRGEVRPQKPRISPFANAKWNRRGQTGEQRMADYNQQMAQYMQPNPVVQPTDPNQQQLPLQQPQVQQPQVQQPQVQQPQMIQASEPMDIAMRLLKAPVYDTDIPGIQFVTQGKDEDWTQDENLHGGLPGLWMKEGKTFPPSERAIPLDPSMADSYENEIEQMTPNNFLEAAGKESMDDGEHYKTLMERAMGGEDMRFVMPRLSEFFPDSPPGHDGRHRMLALRNLGHGDTPVPVSVSEEHIPVQTGEPMDIALQLLKERVSPEAKRHKLEYDKKYESSPERVKYREDLNRERRRRGIYGSHDHKDISHTEGGKLTLEGEHENRARHFKDKGTLRQVNKAQQTLPSYDEKIVQSLIKPDQSTMYISSRPGRETVSAEEQSAKHDELLAAIAELNKNREMNILTGTGKGEWGNENSIAIQNYPLEIKHQLYELARRYGQDAVAESNAREKGIRFVNPASGEDTFSFGGREIQENPRYSTDFPTGQKISFTE